MRTRTCEVTQEAQGTIWVCIDCMLEHANGESSLDRPDSEPTPWSLWQFPGRDITMGMLWEEHHENCSNRAAESITEECDCEHIDFSSSDCDGCGSMLAGERFAFTYWQ